jgi:hypothetical protein
MRLFRNLIAALLFFVTPALATPAIDGVAAFNACGSGSPLTISTALTTANIHDAIIVMVTMGNTPVWVDTVTDTAGLSFTRRAQTASPSINTDRWEEWYAPAAAALTGDTITVTATGSGGSNCIKLMAVGVSGAQWPTPFDPYYNFPNAKGTTSLGAFTTAGTDDLLLAHYGQNGCTGPLPGAGWTALYQISGSDLLEYQTVATAVTGDSATLGNCAGNVQSYWLDAFVASGGLGTVNQASKFVGFVAVAPGMQMSKQLGFIALRPGTAISKMAGFIVLKPAAASVANGGGGLGLFHSFPP